MPDEARAKAVEAAYLAYDTRNHDPMEDAITAFLATMAEAGLVMVRDVGEMEIPTIPTLLTPSARVSYANGWNDCRAAMLKGATDGQG